MIRKMLRYVGYRLIDLSELKYTGQYPNLKGDRDIEWSFISAHIPEGDGYVLDFGNGGSNLGLVAAMNGYQTIALDLNEVVWQYRHPNLKFLKGDLLVENVTKNETFDVIINCSTIEHVGLAGRYGISESDEDGDIRVMNILGDLLFRNGVMVMTVPVGKDAVFPPLHRVYGDERLPKLLKKYRVLHEEYWIKDMDNLWVQCSKKDALSREPSSYLYGIGCFVLRRRVC